jgi:flagellar biogenesis protein FliO
MQIAAPSAGAVSILDLLRSGIESLGSLSRRRFWRKKTRRLRVCDSLSLGNRGFVAVVEYRGQEFLVGGTSTSIALLAEIPLPGNSGDALTGTDAVHSD